MTVRAINRFLFYAYFPVLLLTFRFLPVQPVNEPLESLYFLAAGVFQAGLYLIPSLLLAHMAGWLERNLKIRYLTPVSLLLCSATTLIYLESDYLLFQIYGYHINGFVLNLIGTPGGIASLGLTPESWRSIATVVFLALLVAASLLLLTVRWTRKETPIAGRYSRWLLLLILIAGLVDKTVYGIQDIRSNYNYLQVETDLPLYQPLTFKRFAQRLGIGADRPQDSLADLPARSFNRVRYPLNAVQLVPPEKPLNLIWLVGESLRWDLLDPEIMPASYAFAQTSHHFLNHYSGGNRTRMGMFSMFYGLEGPYWFPFLKQHITPVLIDSLQQQHYDLDVYTSASFSYPEFDQTIFYKLPPSRRHADSEGPGWLRDERNVTRLIEHLESRNTDQPFMGFLFMESTHAPYLFPSGDVIRADFAKRLDYTEMADATPEQALKVFNRYVNSAHHLDRQIGRLLRYLKSNGLLEQTIVVITGDHGEAFMERGRWGHGSDFTDPQIRVPLVLHIPGSGQAEHQELTSHLDIVPTLAPYFGITNPIRDYSNGFDLLDQTSQLHRRNLIVSDWSGVAFLDDRYEVRIPLKTSGYFSGGVTLRNGDPVTDLSRFNRQHLPEVLDALKSMQRFSRNRPSD